MAGSGIASSLEAASKPRAPRASIDDEETKQRQSFVWLHHILIHKVPASKGVGCFLLRIILPVMFLLVGLSLLGTQRFV